MATMLRDSIEHAREDMERRLLTEARVEARRAANAVRSALNADGDLLDERERAAILGATEAVERAISGADRDAISGAVAGLEAATQVFAERRMDRGIRTALAGRHVDQVR
jgi:molecular chaperone HscA